MLIVVLGAAAGGGFPQWNSNSAACARARSDDRAARPATQASIAVSADGARWRLVNASPDIRAQLEAIPTLRPHGEDPLRGTRIDGVVLTNADVDAVAGLLTLREKTAFELHAHARVLDQLAANPIFNVVDRDLVPRVPLTLETATPMSNLTTTAFAAPGKVALYAEDDAAADFGSADGDVVGLEITDEQGKRLIYLGNCAAVTDAVRDRVAGADMLFFDGTLYVDDEMRARGAGVKTGRRMGHISMAGPDGAIAAFADTPIGRRVFIHMNNTNPVLLADSAERAAVEKAGWIVAQDGMELTL